MSLLAIVLVAASTVPFVKPVKVVNGDFGWTSGIAQPVVSADGRIVIWAQLDHFHKPWRLYGAFANDIAHAAPLTDECEGAYGPRLSPDGRLVAYTGFRSGENGWGVCIQDLKTGARRRLCDGHAGGFSPNGKRLLYDRNGLLYEHVLSDLDRPVADWPAPMPIPEDEVLVRVPALEVRNVQPLPSACAFGTNQAFFVRAKVIWDGVDTNVQSIAMLGYASSRSAVQLCVWKGRPAFSLRSVTGRQILTMARAAAPTNTPFVITGLRTAKGYALSVNGEEVRLSPFREGTLPLEEPKELVVLGDAETPSKTRIVGLHVGSGWPHEVPRIMDRAELFNRPQTVSRKKGKNR